MNERAAFRNQERREANDQAAGKAAPALDREGGDQAGRIAAFASAHVRDVALPADRRHSARSGGAEASIDRIDVGLRARGRGKAEEGDGVKHLRSGESVTKRGAARCRRGFQRVRKQRRTASSRQSRT